MKRRASRDIIRSHPLLSPGDHQTHVAAKVVQIPVRGSGNAQLGAAVPADKVHGGAADFHTVAAAAAAAGDTLFPGGNVLELREHLIHDDVVHKGLWALFSLLALLLFRQNGQLPQVLLHDALRADEAAELLGLGAGQGRCPLHHTIRRADGLVGLAADAAGHIEVIFLAVKGHLQRGFTALTLHLRVGRLQSKHRAGPHDGLSAGGTQISKCTHFLAHEYTSSTFLDFVIKF